VGRIIEGHTSARKGCKDSVGLRRRWRYGIVPHVTFVFFACMLYSAFRNSTSSMSMTLANLK
jgi:hypothetical protein